MDRAKILTYLFAVNAVAFTCDGIYIVTNEGTTLGGVLVLLGGVFSLLVTGRQIVRGEFDRVEIPTKDSALWLMVLATICIVVGTTYQVV